MLLACSVEMTFKCASKAVNGINLDLLGSKQVHLKTEYYGQTAQSNCKRKLNFVAHLPMTLSKDNSLTMCTIDFTYESGTYLHSSPCG